MFIDIPSGTGYVVLTVFQSIPVDGIIIVTSPQELVSMIVSKIVKMAEMMSIPIIGLLKIWLILNVRIAKKNIKYLVIASTILIF